jgi:hypothetical protein
MTSDDDVLAKVRASFRAVAARTTIGPSRFSEIAAGSAASAGSTGSAGSAAAARRPGRMWMSIAASVAAVAAVAFFIGSARPASRSVAPAGAGGAASPVSPTSPSSQTPSASLSQSRPCVPANYYVLASAAQLTAMTYLLPKIPAGYRLYGAWGTIARNMCPDSVTWYVEYDPVADGNGSNISVSVTRMGAGTVGPAVDTANTTPGVVAGQPARVFGKGAYGTVTWLRDGLLFTVSAPMTDAKTGGLFALADSLVAVGPGDPRIVAPANCDVPPGRVCDSPTSTAKPPTPTASGGRTGEGPSVSSTLTLSSTPTASLGDTPTPNPSPS